MTWMEWYAALEKPGWTPEGRTIGTIWQILYPIILVTFGFVFLKTWQEKLPVKVAMPFAVNLIANLAFPPIQFTLRNPFGFDRPIWFNARVASEETA